MEKIAQAPAPADSPAKPAKKKNVVKPKKAELKVGDLITNAVTASKDRNGISIRALKKVLSAGGYDVVKKNARVNNAVIKLVNEETLVRVKGRGASGSFKITKGSKKAAPVKKAVVKIPTAAKTTKSVAVKKPVAKRSAQKPATKVKSPKKATAKSPKKATVKKAAAKSPKKATVKKAAAKKAPKSPKKVVVMKAAKSPKAKKPAAKKAPAKKVAKPKTVKTSSKK